MHEKGNKGGKRTEKPVLVKKGEAARFFGYSNTAGYRYLDYLVGQGLLEPRFLPGVKLPRFYMHEIMELVEGDSPSVERFSAKTKY